MKKFSLIMATVGRDECISVFCAHLAEQSYRNFELIIVDQNDDARLDAIIELFSPQFELIHIKSSVKGLSRNRNIGLEYATGDIIAFPDDDCYYNSDTLEHVLNGFLQTGADYYCVNYNDEHCPAESKWGAAERKWIRKRDFFKYGISFSLFIKSEIEMNFRFDEQLGIGGTFGSGEETDLLLYCLAEKQKCYYDGTYCIHHPYTKLYKPDLNRTYSYSLGFGAVHKKAFIFYRNYYAVPRFVFFVFLNFCKMLFLTGRKNSWTALKGKLTGFFSYKTAKKEIK